MWNWYSYQIDIQRRQLADWNCFYWKPIYGIYDVYVDNFFFLCQGKPLERGNPILNMRNQTFSRLCEIGYLGLYFGISHVSDHLFDPKMAKSDPKWVKLVLISIRTKTIIFGHYWSIPVGFKTGKSVSPSLETT